MNKLVQLTFKLNFPPHQAKFIIPAAGEWHSKSSASSSAQRGTQRRTAQATRPWRHEGPDGLHQEVPGEFRWCLCSWYVYDKASSNNSTLVIYFYQLLYAGGHPLLERPPYIISKFDQIRYCSVYTYNVQIHICWLTLITRGLT